MRRTFKTMLLEGSRDLTKQIKYNRKNILFLKWNSFKNENHSNARFITITLPAQ